MKSYYFEAKYYNKQDETVVRCFERENIQFVVNKFVNHCVYFAMLKSHDSHPMIEQFIANKECELVEIEVYTMDEFGNSETIAYKTFRF